MDAAFEHRVIGVHGGAGAAWLLRLPHLLGEVRAAWDLQPAGAFPLGCNYVEPVTRRGDGTAAVLKLSLPGHRELALEAAALRHFDGRGAVRLLEHDAARGALLLERAVPGDAGGEPAAVMERLWSPAPAEHPFPTVEEWAQGFTRHRRAHGGAGPLPAPVFDRAERLFVQLCSSQGERVVLHGDLHPGNVLRATREPLLAIDPKGVVGERAYEPGALLRNSADPARTLQDLLERVDLDGERVRLWGEAQAVLSAVWAIEDGQGGWEDSLRVADALRAG